MVILTATNRTNVTFNIQGFGSELIKKLNAISAISIRYNAQVNVFENKASYTFRESTTGENLARPEWGNTGGTITFHSHSCDHATAAIELIDLLISFGLEPQYFKEVIKTHRDNGDAYKVPQTFVVPA